MKELGTVTVIHCLDDRLQYVQAVIKGQLRLLFEKNVER